MRVYQTRPDGVLIGYAEADESPLQPGVFLIPGGCVVEEPPTFGEGNRARWDGDAWVIEPADIDQPAEPAPDPGAIPAAVTDRQFAQALAETGRITWPEAQAWGARGEIPADLLEAVEDLPEEIDRQRAIMFLGSAQTFERTHPMTIALAAGMGWSDEELDGLWAFAATL
ncbi:MAG: hypothetical protein KYX69_19685 [Sphingomonas sp.]|uniref:hypothetical protein n=1 Tax=Sphingomonas sp. TaxID=28214 RepID=UPI00262BDED9|nr:hypothetical protein [Sphingomonas sp.]MDK2769926.1 hypothetical protein [Sphingomonas sp.]